MEEYSDEDITDRPSLLESDLTCPVCKEIYKEPVLLSCSHSFCQECLESSWKNQAKHLCPLCRKCCDGETPINNRALKNTCLSYKKERNWRGTGIDELMCGLHQRPFQLFCIKDEEPVCVDCVTLHSGHDLCPVDKGVPICKVLQDLHYLPLWCICLYLSYNVTRDTCHTSMGSLTSLL